MNSDDLSLSIIHICSIITCVMFCCAEITPETFLINIAFNGRAVSGPYFGFGVRPANVGPGRSLGLRRAGPASGRPVRTAFDILHGSRTRGDHNPRVLSTYNETILNG